MINFKQKKLSKNEIFNYLIENQDIFIPRLDTRLNIAEYALKLHMYARHFCAFNNEKLVGLIACYYNDHLSRTGFISSVSVNKKYQGLGIMTNLLDLVIDYGKKNNFEKLKLEVRLENNSVTAIYKKVGFYEVTGSKSCVLMEIRLKK